MSFVVFLSVFLDYHVNSLHIIECGCGKPTFPGAVIPFHVLIQIPDDLQPCYRLPVPMKPIYEVVRENRTDPGVWIRDKRNLKDMANSQSNWIKYELRLLAVPSPPSWPPALSCPGGVDWAFSQSNQVVKCLFARGSYSAMVEDFA